MAKSPSKWLRKPEPGKGRATCVNLTGGPFDGTVIYLYHPRSGTLTITAKGRTGRYVALDQVKARFELHWEETRGTNNV